MPVSEADVLDAMAAREWSSSLTILRLLHEGSGEHIERSEVNRVLYVLQQKNLLLCTVGTPPMWKLVTATSQPQTPENPEIIHCVIDLGNVHDCLQHVQRYANAGMLTVDAYADLAYNGFGVAPRVERNAGVRVFRADTPDRNSADVQIIWDLSRYVSNLLETKPESRLHIIVATKDMGFRRLKALVDEARNHRLTFVTDWPSLRLHIE